MTVEPNKIKNSENEVVGCIDDAQFISDSCIYENTKNLVAFTICVHTTYELFASLMCTIKHI
jgi:hypothetical protein